MMLAVDHVACCGPNAQDLIARHVAEGYGREISEVNLENLDIKHRLMGRHADVHDLTLLRRRGSVSIEVLDYHGVGAGGGYLSREATNRFRCRTSDIPGSIVFWTALGFRRSGDDALCFRSPLSGAFEIALRHERSAVLPLLDDVGFNAVAMLSSSIAEDRRLLEAVGNVTEVRKLKVGGRLLELFFVRNAAGGELVEVFGFAKEGRVR